MTRSAPEISSRSSDTCNINPTSAPLYEPPNNIMACDSAALAALVSACAQSGIGLVVSTGYDPAALAVSFAARSRSIIHMHRIRRTSLGRPAT